MVARFQAGTNANTPGYGHELVAVVGRAEARQNFARLIKRAEQGRAIEITRRGESVAVLLSAPEYLKPRGGDRPPFVETTRHVRE